MMDGLKSSLNGWAMFFSRELLGESDCEISGVHCTKVCVDENKFEFVASVCHSAKQPLCQIEEGILDIELVMYETILISQKHAKNQHD